jgi:hypothetical protein
MFPVVLIITTTIRIANIILSRFLEDFCPIETPRGAAKSNPPTNGKKRIGRRYPK